MPQDKGARLSAKASALLLDVYRGKVSAMDAGSIGEYHHADGDWRRAHESTPMGQAWSDLAKAGLIDDYDCFGGFNYCHITKKGKRRAEEQIAAKVKARSGRSPSAITIQEQSKMYQDKLTERPIGKLCPLPMLAQADRLTATVAELAMHAAVRSPNRFLAEIYLAGLWHGAEIARTQNTPE